MTSSQNILQKISDNMTSGISQNIESVSTRAKTVMKYSAIGTLAGASTGAAIGGFVELGIYSAAEQTAFWDYVKNDASNCTMGTYPDGCRKIDCPDPNQIPIVRQAANAHGHAAGASAAADKAGLVMLISTVGGAGLGFFGGALYGWRKKLPQQEQPDASQEETNMNVYRKI